MTRKRKPYKTYTKEFKEEAVRMMESSDRPAAEIAMELGIRRNQLYKWKEQMENKGDKAFSGRGRPKKEDQSEEQKKGTHLFFKEINRRVLVFVSME